MEQTHEGGEPCKSPGKKAILQGEEAFWVCSTSRAKALNFPNAYQLTFLLQRSRSQCVSLQIHIEMLTQQIHTERDSMSRWGLLEC